MKKSLRFKFLLVAFVLVVSGITILVSINYLNVRRAMLETLREGASLSCRGYAHDISGDVAAKLQLLLTWARNPLAARACQNLDVSQANVYLMEYIQGVEDIVNSNFWSITGANTASSDPANVGKVNISDREYFREVTKEKKTNVLSPAVISRGTGHPVCIMAQPVLDQNGNPVGVVNANLNLQSITAKLAKERIGSTGYFFILDKSGKVLAHPDASLVMKDEIAESAIGQRMLAVKESAVLEYEEGGAPRMAAVTRDPVTGWTFVALAPLEDMAASLESVTIRNTAVAAGTTLVLLAGLALCVGRFILDPLDKTVVFSSRVAEGHLDAQLELDRADELGTLAVSLRRMLSALKAKVSEADALSREAGLKSQEAEQARFVAEEATRRAELAREEGMLQAAGKLGHVVAAVSTATETLTAQIEDSGRRISEQSQRVAETATAIEEMNTTVAEVAKNADQASQSSEMTRQRAIAGAQVVCRVVESIGVVQAQSMTLKQEMSHLGAQAQNIGQVMNVISDIADQTNLLALNAAIEAARAGDAGRGFAVVADEVRKLAEKTMSATRDVGEAIQGIQLGARQNMENVDKAVEIINQATTLANESGGALNEIVNLAEQASDQVRSIAIASEQQSCASEEINRSSEDVNRMSMENAQAMGQAAQAVAELMRQAQVLNGLIVSMEAEGARNAIPPHLKGRE